VVALAVELGAGSVKFNPVTCGGRGIAMHERGESLDVEEILRLAHFVRGELQRRTPIELILSTPQAFYTVGEFVGGAAGGQCHIQHILGILGSGEMALCGIGQHIAELCFGNLAHTGVAEVWTGHPLLCRLRRELAGEYSGLCGRCLHARRCLAFCAAQNYQDTGQLVSPYWLCTAAYEQGFFPASRLREKA